MITISSNTLAPTQTRDAAQQAVSAAISQASGPIVVAVSGGSDSMALLSLANAAAKHLSRQVIALTVNHGLRPEAAAEAAWVATECSRQGIDHQTLTWSAPKPSTGIPAAARSARYALLAAQARQCGADRLLVGHTLDDQAETVAFRIASGAGWRAAAGLRALTPCPIWPEGHDILLARPLLGSRRTDLQAMLRAEGTEWITDPSNENHAFARPRMRQLLANQEALYPGTIAKLADIGTRLCLEQTFIEAAAIKLVRAHLSFDQYGAGIFNLQPLHATSPDIRAAALSFAILATSGQPTAPARSDVLSAWAALSETAGTISLGGARIERSGNSQAAALILTRDTGAVAGRAGMPLAEPLFIAPGETKIFDGRFMMNAPTSMEEPVKIIAMGPEVRRGIYPSQSIKIALAPTKLHSRAALPKIIFTNNSAHAPLFAPTQSNPKKTQDIDKNNIIAKFLGPSRLEGLHQALSAAQNTSF